MPYNVPASQQTLDTTVSALRSKGFDVRVADSQADALDMIKSIIPQGASVMNGASKTLEQIGYPEYLKNGNHGWIDLRKTVTAENDPVKRTALRKQSTLSEYYLGSTNALTTQGEMIFGSNTGSQLPQIAYTSSNVILVIGTQKIVPTISDGMKRIEDYVVPLEDAHMRELFGIGTHLNKILIYKGELPALKRQIHVIFIKESVGY